MSSPEDTTGEEEPSEEEVAAFGLAIHYIRVMEGPRWVASFSERITEELRFALQGDSMGNVDLFILLDFTAYMMAKYPQWFQFLTTHASTHLSETTGFDFEGRSHTRWSQNENIDTKLFLNEGIQELIYDDSVKEILSMQQDLPKVSNFGQGPPNPFAHRNPLKQLEEKQNCKMYLAPNIPTKKLKNGISNDRFGVNGLFKETDVFAMIDEKTMMFAAKNGLMITNIGIFWRSSKYEYGGLPWRINDSRMTGVITHAFTPISPLHLAVVIDDDLVLPIGGLGMVFGPEADVIATLMSAMIDIANEQYNSSN
tara:strand:+ start:34 stop:966 length:933 start_codon:yes stop_codon:yes gene_type:complete